MAAASSLRSLWPALIESYTSNTDRPAPRVSFGSSGLLATQIINGAPFDIFLSADGASIDRIPKDKLAASPNVFAQGDLHLVVLEDSELLMPLSLQTLVTRITSHTDGPLLRIAIPNPVHAPYGLAAREALDSVGIWPLPAQQLLAAENAAQTLQFIKSGAVDAAIVPAALVLAYSQTLVSVPLPANSYTPVAHTLALLSNADESAQGFAQWLLKPDAATVFKDGGLRVAEKKLDR